MKKLLIFGGTTEGREITDDALARGYAVTVTVAREYGRQFLPEGTRGLTVLAGHLDEPAMETLMVSGEFCAVIDATHPYAVEVSRFIRAACAARGLSYLRLLRSASDARDCRSFPSLGEACRWLGGTQGNILAATGSREIAAYRAIPDFAGRVWARVLPTADSLALCQAAGLPPDHILEGRGPFSREQNARVLQTCGIRWLVTKDGGPEGGFQAKLDAARETGAELIVIARPPESGMTYSEVKQWLEENAER